MSGGHRRAEADASATKATRTKIAVISGACVAVISAAGFGAYSLLGSDAGESGPAANSSAVPTGPPTKKEVKAVSRDFLAAWAAGKPKDAAALTNDADAALAALKAFPKDASVSKVSLKPGKPAGNRVPYAVSARVSYKGTRTELAYDSALEVVRDKVNGSVFVDWQPTVLHPKLGEGERLRTGERAAPPIKAVDRDGDVLDAKEFPSLGPVLAGLREKYGTRVGGTPGAEVWIESAEPAGTHKDPDKDDGKTPPPETLMVLSKGTPGTVKTTIDPVVQASAEASVAGTKKGSIVAVKPSTGEILAIANNPATGFNTALQGSMAPGSTMKVVTAAMLLEKGLAGPTKSHPCPEYASYGGWKFENAGKDSFEIKNGTFTDSFLQSCNTAFITQAEKLKDDDLTKTARDVFGIGLNWQTGASTFDGRVPVQSDAQMAASLMGQGGVRMNPLTMASVSATVKSGVFKQPYLVAPSVDDRSLAKAPRTMPAKVASDLRGLMKGTAQSGTAAEAMRGLSGDVGAKTGSAEVDGQDKENAWFTAYRNDLAVAAVVPDSGHGGEFAGPVVKAVLAAQG